MFKTENTNVEHRLLPRGTEASSPASSGLLQRARGMAAEWAGYQGVWSRPTRLVREQRCGGGRRHDTGRDAVVGVRHGQRRGLMATRYAWEKAVGGVGE